MSKELFEVEEIRAARRAAINDRSITHVLIKWLGYTEAQKSWEPVKHVMDPDLLSKYESSGDNWQWEYYLSEKQDGLSAGWHPINPAVWKTLNREFTFLLADYEQKGEMIHEVSIHTGKYCYDIDLKAMTQRNRTHPSHTVRPIRCLPVYPAAV